MRLDRIATVAGYYDGRQVWYIEEPQGCGDEYVYDTRTAATYALLCCGDEYVYDTRTAATYALLLGWEV